jgi:hypothetical protein
MGDIKIKTQDGNELVLQDVRYAPRAHKNLISLGELHGIGYVYYAHRDKLTMRVKKDMKSSRTRNSMYKVHVCVGVLDTGVSRSTCSWAPSTAQLRPKGGTTTEASGEDPHEEAPHEENDDQNC